MALYDPVAPLEQVPLVKRKPLPPLGGIQPYDVPAPQNPISTAGGVTPAFIPIAPPPPIPASNYLPPISTQGGVKPPEGITFVAPPPPIPMQPFQPPPVAAPPPIPPISTQGGVKPPTIGLQGPGPETLQPQRPSPTIPWAPGPETLKPNVGITPVAPPPPIPASNSLPPAQAPIPTGEPGGGAATQQVGPQGIITERAENFLPPISTQGGAKPPTIGLQGPGPETFQPPPAPIPTGPGGPGGYIPPRTSAGPSPLTEFGPGDNLIGTQVNPLASQRLQRNQSATDAALAGLESFGPFAPAADTGRLRDLTTRGVEDLYSAPNREAIALQTLQNLDAAQADQQKLGIQDIGRAGARLGRLGSGMVTTDLGNLKDRLNTERERTLRGLSADTAAQEMADRLNRVGATQSAGSQLFGQDVTGSETEFGRRVAQTGVTAGLEGQRFGQEAATRGEVRGERGYQSQAEQDAINNAVRQYMLEQGGQAQDFGQQYDIASLLGGYGFGSSAGVPLDVANNLGAQGQDAGAALAELLAQLGQRRG